MVKLGEDWFGTGKAILSTQWVIKLWIMLLQEGVELDGVNKIKKGSSELNDKSTGGSWREKPFTSPRAAVLDTGR